MTLRTIIFVVSALLVAGVTALFARGLIMAKTAAPPQVAAQPAQPAQPSVQVLVAAEDMSAGQFVREKSLRWQAWPDGGLADGYVVKGRGDNLSPKDFAGAVVRITIPAGEPVTRKRLVHPGDRGFLAAVLEPRMRAISVPVNATSGVSGFVFPGDLVDVILTVKFSQKDEGSSKSRSRWATRTLLSGIRVLAIDQKIENEDGTVKPLKTVTLEVTPGQAERIAMALEIGSLSLSLQALARSDPRLEALHAEQVAEAGERRRVVLDHEVSGLSLGGARRKTVIHVLRGNDAQTATY